MFLALYIWWKMYAPPGQARQQTGPELAAPNRPFPPIAPASRRG
jgi:hypothetical protein